MSHTLLENLDRTRPAVFDVRVARQNSKLEPLLNRLAERKLSFRQFAYLGKAFAIEHRQPKLAFNHVSVSHWFSGRRNPNPAHRQMIATLLQLPLALVDDAFDSRQPLPAGTSPTRAAIVYVMGRDRQFEYPLTMRPDLDLTVPAVYEDEQWERMFSVYPANLKRHVNGSRAKLCGWVPDETFKPLIPHSRCLVLLKRPTTIPTLSDPAGFDRRLWFLGLPSGEVDVRFMYREGTQLVTSKPNQAEQRFSKDAVDPLGYVTGTMLFRLELRCEREIPT
jgi:hypothetical protein